MATPAFSDAVDGALEQYFKEISQYPLIDRDEEVRLAQGIRRGDDEALDKLVMSNLRFVVSMSKKYRNQGVPLPDLINEGNVGLIRAAQRFDERKGTRFVTYAAWWITAGDSPGLWPSRAASFGSPSTAPARCVASPAAGRSWRRSWAGSRRRRRSHAF